MINVFLHFYKKISNKYFHIFSIVSILNFTLNIYRKSTIDTVFFNFLFKIF